MIHFFSRFVKRNSKNHEKAETGVPGRAASRQLLVASRTEKAVRSFDWEKTAEGYSYTFTVPEGCTATVILPGKTAEIGAGTYTF